MQNLSEFDPPQAGALPLCELNGKLFRETVELNQISQITNVLDNHPQVHITHDMLHQTIRNECQSLFVPVDEPLLKRLLQTYYDEGVLQCFHTMREHHTPIVSSVASAVLSVVDWWSQVREKLQFAPLKSGVVIDECSQTRNWFRGPVRCIAWDTYAIKFAVATADDCIRIYAHKSSTVPLLKCAQQQQISCMEWRPLSNSELAVGCANGILIWNIEPTSVVTRPSINNMTVLYRIEHTPVLSLAWNCLGDLLFSVAANDSRILVWNVEMDQTSSLKRPGNSGNSLVLLSAKGKRMLSATTSVIFRVWDCLSWEAERWGLLCGRIQAACWSPCGSVLLFATSDEPILYSLSMAQTDIFSTNDENVPNKATPIYDLSKGDLDGHVVGGLVQSMQWDSKGNYFAILFQDTNYVALFIVTSTPVMRINPHYLINGMSTEVPTVIEFQKNCDFGACLTIVWSSGRLQHFPIVYTPCDSP